MKNRYAKCCIVPREIEVYIAYPVSQLNFANAQPLKQKGSCRQPILPATCRFAVFLGGIEQFVERTVVI